MTTLLIIALIAVNIGQYLNNLDLKAELQSRPTRPENNSLEVAFRFGVTPEGLENAAHRKTEFPKIK